MTYEETAQEYIIRTLRTLHDRLLSQFNKFVDEQVRGIEETKVKLKKRKGIVSFMRIFPLFSQAVEAMMVTDAASSYHPTTPTGAPVSLEVRFTVNDAYHRLQKAMWDALNFIAKDDGGQAAASSTLNNADPEDKEALNYHITLIENMNYFHEELETHGNTTLEDMKDRANADMLFHLAQYTNAVIRRPLGKWLEFLEGMEAAISASDSGPAGYGSIATKPSHNRKACKHILQAYDSKEIRKGIDVLKRRIEKHFDSADEPSSVHAGQSKSLVARVFEECARRYAHAHDRMQDIINKVYEPESKLAIDWTKEEVATMFR